MPDANPEIVVVVPFPVEVVPPGVLVSVQFPAGRPLSTTLPVAVSQVGWVIVPIIGAVGNPGAASITILVDCAEVQPSAFATV